MLMKRAAFEGGGRTHQSSVRKIDKLSRLGTWNGLPSKREPPTWPLVYPNEQLDIGSAIDPSSLSCNNRDPTHRNPSEVIALTGKRVLC